MHFALTNRINLGAVIRNAFKNDSSPSPQFRKQATFVTNSNILVFVGGKLSRLFHVFMPLDSQFLFTFVYN